MANGSIPEPEQYIDNKSGNDIAFFVEKPVPVFKENMDETVIRDGFHSSDDVYQNVKSD